jgi:hypothetical protein
MATQMSATPRMKSIAAMRTRLITLEEMRGLVDRLGAFGLQEKA